MRYGPDDPKVQETLTIIRQLHVNPSLPNMKNYLQNVDVLDTEAHETLRQVFEDVSTMTEEELDTLAAALDAESINGLDDILLIEQSLDAYTFWPDVTTDEELGIFLMEYGYVGASPDIAPYVNCAMLGASYYAAHGGAYGPKGYAQRTGIIDPVFKAVIQSCETEESALFREQMPEEKERGLMHWYHDTDLLGQKVRSIVFTVEERNRQLWGVAECQITQDLNPQEMHRLKDYISGQASDGWGEGFEQREIHVGDGAELYVHLWNGSDSWSIQTEEECFGQKQSPQMGGMTLG